MRLKPEIYTPPGSRFLQGLATKSKHAIAVTGLSIFLGAMAWGAEIRFTTLPEVVRTTVIHETGILGPDKVVRVVRVPDDIYEITVLTDTGQRVLYVTEDGTIVQRPGVAVDEGSTSDSEEVTITMDEIQRGGDRYRFVEDQGPDKVYIDTQSNKRVIVKNESTNVNENRRSVRGHEGTNEQNVTRERNQIGSQKNDENVKEQNGATRSNQENMRREQNTENKGAGQGERNPEMQNNQGQNNQRQNKEGSNSKMGTEERPGAGRNTKGEMSPKESRGTTNQQEQKGAQRGQGKEKASPTP